MTPIEKPERDWRDIAEDLTKATEAGKVLDLAKELERAIDKADEEKKHPGT